MTMTNGNGKHPPTATVEDDIQDSFIPLEPEDMTTPETPPPAQALDKPPARPNHLFTWLRGLIFGDGKFSPTRFLLLGAIVWIVVSAVTNRPPTIRETTTAQPQTKEQSLEADRTIKGVMYRVTGRYDEDSKAVRLDAVQALARVYIDHANEDPDPYGYLARQINDRLYDLNQLKGKKLVWSGAEIDQAAKYQLHLDALAVATNATAQETQSNLDRSVDLIPLVKAGETQMGVYQRQVIPAFTDPAPPSPEPGFRIPFPFTQSPPQPKGTN
jgi:hypothetical protein